MNDRWVARRIMRLKHTSLAIALIVLFSSVGTPQTPTTNQGRVTPDFRVQVWGYIVADFSSRVWSYFELRSQLEKGLPALRVTDDPGEIRRAVRALAKRIRIARAEAKQGDIFTPIISVEFRKAPAPRNERQHVGGHHGRQPGRVVESD